LFSGNFAAPSERLIDLTVKAATVRAARNALKAGLVSASAAAMTEGVLHTMFVSNWKLIALTLLAVGASTSAIGLYARQVPEGAVKSDAQTAISRENSLGSPGGVNQIAPSSDTRHRARWLLREAREQLLTGNFDVAQRNADEADALKVKWGLFDDTPAKVSEEIEKARPKSVATRAAAENSDSLAAEIEDLLKQVRRKQAQGDIEGAVRDLHRIELGAFQWRMALSKQPGEGIRPQDQRPSVSGRLLFRDKTDPAVKSPKSPGPTTASGPRSTENRLDELEHKIDRVLRVLERDHDRGPELSPNNSPARREIAPPPNLVGRITKVDSRAPVVEIDIGSDDGLAPGHELNIYRVDPTTRSPTKSCVGRIQVSRVDPDQAVAKITEQSAKTSIKQGDQVSPLGNSAGRE
jgi:hypothetical protein